MVACVLVHVGGEGARRDRAHDDALARQAQRHPARELDQPGLARSVGVRFLRIDRAIRPLDVGRAVLKHAAVAGALLPLVDVPAQDGRQAGVNRDSRAPAIDRRATFEAARALQISDKNMIVRWMVVLTYEALGRRDLTLPLLEDAPASILDRLNRFPDLADLRADPRFKQLLVTHNIR